MIVHTSTLTATAIGGFRRPTRIFATDDSSNQTESRAKLLPREKKQKMEIYVGNLPWSVGDQELADAFKAYGTVERASVIVERPSGRSKGFGFVTMNDDSEANQAIEGLNGTELAGRPLKVNQARAKD